MDCSYPHKPTLQSRCTCSDNALGGEGEQPLFEPMFEARKRLFIDLLYWDLEVVDERFEIDRFDDT